MGVSEKLLNITNVILQILSSMWIFTSSASLSCPQEYNSTTWCLLKKSKSRPKSLASSSTSLHQLTTGLHLTGPTPGNGADIAISSLSLVWT